MIDLLLSGWLCVSLGTLCIELWTDTRLSRGAYGWLVAGIILAPLVYVLVVVVKLEQRRAQWKSRRLRKL